MDRDLLVKRYMDSGGYFPANTVEKGDWVLLERDPLTKRDLRGFQDPVDVFEDMPYLDALDMVVGRDDYPDKRLEYSLEKHIVVEDLVWDRDADDIMDLERQVFAYPWSPQGFVVELDSPIICGVVARYRDGFAGYSINRCIKPRLKISNIAVVPELQQERVGMRLVDEAFDRAAKTGVDTLNATVCSQDDRTVDFFKGLWFYHARTQKREEEPDRWVFEFKLPSAYGDFSFPRLRQSKLV